MKEFERALAAVNQGDFLEAEKFLRRCKIDDDGLVDFMLGLILARQERNDEAVEFIQASLQKRSLQGVSSKVALTRKILVSLLMKLPGKQEDILYHQAICVQEAQILLGSEDPETLRAIEIYQNIKNDNSSVMSLE